MHLLAFAASHRPDSLNRKLINAALLPLKKAGVSVETADYAEFDMPVYNDIERQEGRIPAAAEALRTRLNKVDGILIASPEYNWSYPGSLKNIIDWISHFAPNPLAGKTALLLSATPSKRGGVIGMLQLKVPLEALEVHVFPAVFSLSEANNAFTGENRLSAPEKQERLETMVQEYVAYAKALKAVAR